MRNVANTEMNAQIRNLRELFLCNQFPDYQLVQNCLTADSKNGPMQLSPLMAPHFEDVDELMNVIQSNHMYTCAPLYDTICRGFETGKLRGTKNRKPTALHSLMTTAHEAHFRCEIGGPMERQSFSWGLGPANNTLRENRFAEQLELTMEDRGDNASAAWEKRQKSYDEASDDSGDESEHDPEKGVTVDSKYY